MDHNILEIAAKAMKISVEEVKKYQKVVPEIDGWYFWNPIRGGIGVLVNVAGEKLAATSGVSFEKHLKAFQGGKRN